MKFVSFLAILIFSPTLSASYSLDVNERGQIYVEGDGGSDIISEKARSGYDEILPTLGLAGDALNGGLGGFVSGGQNPGEHGVAILYCPFGVRKQGNPPCDPAECKPTEKLKKHLFGDDHSSQVEVYSQGTETVLISKKHFEEKSGREFNCGGINSEQNSASSCSFVGRKGVNDRIEKKVVNDSLKRLREYFPDAALPCNIKILSIVEESEKVSPEKLQREGGGGANLDDGDTRVVMLTKKTQTDVNRDHRFHELTHLFQFKGTPYWHPFSWFVNFKDNLQQRSQQKPSLVELCKIQKANESCSPKANSLNFFSGLEENDKSFGNKESGQCYYSFSAWGGAEYLLLFDQKLEELSKQKGINPPINLINFMRYQQKKDRERQAQAQGKDASEPICTKVPKADELPMCNGEANENLQTDPRRQSSMPSTADSFKNDFAEYLQSHSAGASKIGDIFNEAAAETLNQPVSSLIQKQGANCDDLNGQGQAPNHQEDRQDQ